MTPVQAKRLSFWEHNREAAMMALSGMDATAEDLMVVVVDMRDKVGKPLVDALAQIKGVSSRAHFEKIEKKGEIPTAIMVLPVEAVARIVAAPNPNVSAALKTGAIMPGMIWVAIIAEGGTMLMQVANEPIQASGQG